MSGSTPCTRTSKPKRRLTPSEKPGGSACWPDSVSSGRQRRGRERTARPWSPSAVWPSRLLWRRSTLSVPGGRAGAVEQSEPAAAGRRRRGSGRRWPNQAVQPHLIEGERRGLTFDPVPLGWTRTVKAGVWIWSTAGASAEGRSGGPLWGWMKRGCCAGELADSRSVGDG